MLDVAVLRMVIDIHTRGSRYHGYLLMLISTHNKISRALYISMQYVLQEQENDHHAAIDSNTHTETLLYGSKNILSTATSNM
jgi:mannose/fructose-specific phosphotransferase system component IIA